MSLPSNVFDLAFGPASVYQLLRREAVAFKAFGSVFINSIDRPGAQFLCSYCRDKLI